MTEHEWLVCTDPEPMLEFLRTQRTASPRKLRLFAAACLRRVWDWLSDTNRHAIQMLETSAVLTVASTIYYDRKFEMFSSLGSALVAAGCENEDILRHCQQQHGHARGCWVLDALLGRC